jgi:hypothetical protein
VEVDPNLEINVESDAVFPNVIPSSSSRSRRRPARYRDEDFVTHFDNEKDNEIQPVVRSEQSMNELVKTIVKNNDAVESEVRESLEILLAFTDQRENVFNMSIKAAVSKWKDKAVGAVRDELSQMIDKKVWTAVKKSSIPRSYKIIPSFMFLKEKYLANGELERIKARLVAGGHIQDITPYEDTSSPTADLTSVFVIYTIAAREKRKVVTVDIKGAYLNAQIKEKVFMKLSKEMTEIMLTLPDGQEKFGRMVDSNDKCLYVQLDKALYGCVESAQLWFMELKSFMENLGFVANPADECIYNKLNADGSQLTVTTYVDDLTITCVNETHIDSLLDLLKDKYQEITIKRGNEHFYLGMLFTLDYTLGVVNVSMNKYVDELLKENDVSGVSQFPSPVDLLDHDDEDPSAVLLPIK